MSNSTAVSAKRGRPAVKGPAILLALKSNPGQTVKELQTNMPMLLTLKEKGYIEVKGIRQTGTRGRPQNEFRLTLNGHNKVRSILAAQAKTEVVAEVEAPAVAVA